MRVVSTWRLWIAKVIADVALLMLPGHRPAITLEYMEDGTDCQIRMEAGNNGWIRVTETRIS